VCLMMEHNNNNDNNMRTIDPSKRAFTLQTTNGCHFFYFRQTQTLPRQSWWLWQLAVYTTSHAMIKVEKAVRDEPSSPTLLRLKRAPYDPILLHIYRAIFFRVHTVPHPIICPRCRHHVLAHD